MSGNTALRLTVTLLATLVLPVGASAGTHLQYLLEQGQTGCAGLATASTPAGRQLLSFYRQRQMQPLWNAPRQQQLAGQIAALADDGLNPTRYPLPAALHDRQTPEADCNELLASQSMLQALHDLHHGLLDSPLEPLWHPSPTPQTDHSVQLAGSGEDPAAAFQKARPVAPQYQRLQRLYARLRQLPADDWPLLPQGRLLVKPGEADPRLPDLARRLSAEAYLPASFSLPENPLLDGELGAALQHFQQRHGLQPDGALGPATLNELNISAARRLQQIRLNLERWRWLNQELESDMLLVDVTATQASLLLDGRVAWQTPVQVGRPERATPLLKSRITRITLNPTWTVPPTVLNEDKLPEIRSNPAYLEKHQLRVLDREGNELDPASVDWESAQGIVLRQDAGPRNALGQVAFRFANPYAIYLHDTPNQRLFNRLPRMHSSGCVRVGQAGQLRDLLLARLPETERTRIQQLQADGQTHEIHLPKGLPVLIAYWTADADEEGALFRPDPYDLDRPALARLLPSL